MSHLPTEVLNNIFNYLHYEQKLECMLVCSRWAHVIRKISLFQTLVLQPNDGFQDYNLLIKKLEKDPQQSSQVRRLIIFGGFDPAGEANKLAHMFPQLQELYLRQFHVLRPDFTTIEAAEQLSRGWKQSLQRLVERLTSVFTATLLRTGVFRRLTDLTLSSGGEDRHSQSAASIFPLFKNAPSLDRLELGDFDISWQEFELLHTNTPLLTTLLLNSIITSHERPMISSIEPTAQITTLAIRYCQLSYDLQFHWIQYITHKYTYLQHFTFLVTHEPDQRQVEAEEYHQRLVIPLVNRLGTQLETFVLKHGLTTPRLFEALDSKSYHLKKLSMDLFDTPESNASLFRSSQAATLQTLSLTRADFKTFKHHFSGFHQLATLKLSFKKDQVVQDQTLVSVALNEILIELPGQLESLTLISCAVRIEPFVSRCPSGLTSLAFEYAELDGEVSTFISDYCHHLRKLSIILCQPGLSTIYLPYHPLSCVEVFAQNTQTIFMLTRGDQTTYYPMNRVLFRGLKGIKNYFDILDTPAFATRTSICGPIHSHQPVIHLTCASLNALYVNTRLAI